MRSRRLFAAVAILAGTAASSPLLAQSPPSGMNLIVSQQGGTSWNWQAHQNVGTWSSDGTNPNLWHHAGSIANAAFAAQWNLDLDSDPFVSNNFALTNNSALTQIFNVTVILPVAPIVLAPTSTFGSVSGSLGDTNNNGFAQMTTGGAGSAIYNAFIDGGLYQQLLPDFYSVITPAVPGATTPFPFGVNFFNFPGGQPGVVTSIAITNTFTLTPGDSVTMVSTFRVDPVPGPASVALLSLGGLVAARRRRI
jgi:MYXO-CTERM domain-containing protein